jgi:hypothetical protein
VREVGAEQRSEDVKTQNVLGSRMESTDLGRSLVVRSEHFEPDVLSRHGEMLPVDRNAFLWIRTHNRSRSRNNRSKRGYWGHIVTTSIFVHEDFAQF